MQTRLLPSFVITLLICYTSVVQGQPITNGLVGYWPMNGNFNDISGSGLNGTNTGVAGTTNKFGVANSAMAFTGPGGFSTPTQYGIVPLNTTINFSGNQNFTVSFLFSINSPFVANEALFDNNINFNGYGAFVMQPAPNVYRLYFNYKNGSLPSGNIPLATWIHATLVRQNGTLFCYLNGVLSAFIAEGTQTPSYLHGTHFGAMYYSSPIIRYNQLIGRMDEFRIFNRALSAAEIAQLNSSVLPLKLGDFSAHMKPNSVLLNWETLSEENTASFTVERSSDGSNFSSIGSINASGQSTTPRSYTFSDPNPLLGTSYYRLKMTDLDQTHTYSRVITVRKEAGKTSLQLYPNPVANDLQLRIPMARSGATVIRISDAAGRVLYTKTAVLPQGDNTLSISIGYWSPGVYHLVLENDGERTSKTFKKQ